MTTEKNWKIFRGSNDIKTLPKAPSWRGNSAETHNAFVPTEEEIDLVNTALYLRRPLLITGKPGTGKSALAKLVAQELGLGEVLSWHITTQSTLKDALYSYDAVARLHDASMSKKTEEEENIGKYITLGAIGSAFAESKEKKIRVILIDEIDKSDIDLPNNLLHVLEENQFKIPELERSVTEEHDVKTLDGKSAKVTKGNIEANIDNFPLIVMTSNGEREFPPAFLRRCIHLTMKPRREFSQLENIISNHIELDDDKRAKLKNIIEEFIAKDTEKEYLAIDQLLNRVFLELEGINIENNEPLLKSIWKSLSV
jgi:MoxR-like ATPase